MKNPAPPINYVENILKVYDRATESEIAEGMNWYSDARDTCFEIAVKYRLGLRLVCYVCAVLSPANKWQRNIVDTDKVCSMFASGELKALLESGTGFRGISATYTQNVDKAYSILVSGSLRYIGKGKKTNSFADNIYCLDSNSVTIDFHAFSVATGFKYTTKNVPSNLLKKEYENIAQAYRDAGAMKGILGKQMQAITWLAWRGNLR